MTQINYWYTRKTIPITKHKEQYQILRNEADAAKRTALEAIHTNDRLLTQIEIMQFRFNMLFTAILTFAAGYSLWFLLSDLFQ